MNVLFVSRWGLIHDLAWQVQKEGHVVKYAILSKNDRDVVDGLVPKVEDLKNEKKWADLIVFDDADFGEVSEKLRKEGKAVIGGNPYTDRLEDDRDFGQEEMKAAGLNVLPNWDFNSFDD